jgi:hypothetical protein
MLVGLPCNKPLHTIVNEALGTNYQKDELELTDQTMVYEPETDTSRHCALVYSKTDNRHISILII